MLSDAVEPNLDDSASASSDPASSGTTVSSGGDTTETNSADPTIAGYAASDGPTTDDTLGFKPYVEAIASFLTAANTKPPITISIEGEWGSGKSSFLLQLEKAILEISPKDAAKPLTVRFNAWRHDKQDQLWAAFALAFIESLRKKIGFWPALWGDCQLFVTRLDTLPRKFAATLVFLCYAILGQQAVRAIGQYVVVSWHALILLHHAILSIPSFHLCCKTSVLKGLIAALIEPKDHVDTIAELASHATSGVFVLLVIAAVWKLRDTFKLPLSLDLKKYLADPGYEGHTAFVETFHKDLKRLVESYAGQSRVYVFIDDLDRCDVPRAAELMQAINLMIGNTGNLVFILGMDREKVAAGVALKYKDLLPFMRESALWKPGADKNDFTPLYFGYAYLEKFIQLSFTLPTPNTEAALNQFLSAKTSTTKPASKPLIKAREERFVQYLYNFKSFFLKYLAPLLKLTGLTVTAEATKPADATIEPTSTETSTGTNTTPTPSATEYHRVPRTEDDDRIRAIIRMTAPLFEYNPRRIKQFTNTFRLSLYLASELGLFDVLADAPSTDPTRPTPEQLGKFIALLLHFPDLRFALEEDPKLLATLEREALAIKFPSTQTPEQPNSIHARWFEHPGAIDLFTSKISKNYTMYGDSPDINGQRNETPRYSLAHFNIAGLFTILPKAAPPPKTQPSTPSVYDQLAALALQYEEIRSSERFSTERTQRMADLFKQAQAAARQGFTSDTAPAGTPIIGSPRGSGARIIFLAIASVFIDRRNAPILLLILLKPRSPFEHYHCIETWLQYVNPESSSQVLEALDKNWDEIAKDAPRLKLARKLRSAAQKATRRTSTSTA